MKAWVKFWTLRLSMAATCLILVIGLAIGIRPPVMVFRSLVVGAVLYFGLRLLGGLVGASLLRLAAEHRIAQEEKRAAEKVAQEQEAGGSAAPRASRSPAPAASAPASAGSPELESPAVEEAAA